MTAIAAAAGERHSCALVTSGGLMCWGMNGNGQLGIGSITRQLSAQAVNLGPGAPGDAKWAQERFNFAHAR